MTQDNHTITALRAENDSLRQRIAELERSPAPPIVRELPLAAGLLEDIPFPATLYQPDGLLMAANARVEQLFGVTRAATVGIYNLLEDPSTLTNGVRAAFEQALAGQISTVPPVQYSRADATDDPSTAQQIWFETTACPLHQDAGVGYVAFFFQDVSEAVAALNELRRSQDLLSGVIDNNPAGISVIDTERRILLVNDAVATNMGLPREQIVGKRQEELFPEEVVAEWAVSDRQVIEGRQALSAENMAPMPDGEHTFISTKFPLFDTQGQVYAIGNIITDITEQKHAEAERLALREEVIAAQQAALRELSTPLIPIAEGVVAMPLVGAIDSWRVQQIMESLLEGIAALQAETAILDITGVKMVDTQVAGALLQTARAAQLLGTRVVITGISPEIAQSLVYLGADLSALITRSNLQSGIAFALGQQS